MGRPKKPIDPEQVRKLAERLWTSAEIGAFLGVSYKTLERRFVQVMEEGRHSGRTKLKDHLWVRALGGRTKEGVLVPPSDRVFEIALNRFLGPVTNKIEITREKAIEFLEKELEREEANSESNNESEDVEF